MFTEEQKERIYSLHIIDKLPVKAIANLYGVSPQTIYNIINEQKTEKYYETQISQLQQEISQLQQENTQLQQERYNAMVNGVYLAAMVQSHHPQTKPFISFLENK